MGLNLRLQKTAFGKTQKLLFFPYLPYERVNGLHLAVVLKNSRVPEAGSG
jgi:hypothetical protein